MEECIRCPGPIPQKGQTRKKVPTSCHGSSTSPVFLMFAHLSPSLVDHLPIGVRIGVRDFPGHLRCSGVRLEETMPAPSSADVHRKPMPANPQIWGPVPQRVGQASNSCRSVSRSASQPVSKPAGQSVRPSFLPSFLPVVLRNTLDV